ncbi:hypothetical protein DH09_01005 (plasmid) [Bacillaceae bacterium JMAK1]|nr:hypothetical protein DH09_01005 [Bacillaceae bacterium JMAK1]
MIIIIITNILYFIVFSLFIGFFIVRSVPPLYRPDLNVPKPFISLLFISIFILGTIPLVDTAFLIMSFESTSFTNALGSLFTEYSIGQSYLDFLLFYVITIISLKWIKQDKLKWLILIPIFGMVFAYSWTTHPAALSIAGYVFYVLHFIAAMSWVGTLTIISFFTKGETKWISFMKWFTPLGITAVILVFMSGIGMMLLITPNYADSLLLNYGQLQLIKHLLFIPLVFYGFAHGFILKHKMDDEYSRIGIKPRKSFQIETVILLFVFIVTGFMSSSEPPHDVAETLQRVEASSLGMFFIGDGTFNLENFVSIDFNFLSFILLIIAIGSLGCMTILIGNNSNKNWLVPITLLSFVFLMYFSIMFSANMDTIESTLYYNGPLPFNIIYLHN